MEIIHAQLAHLDDLVPLFDQYRVFYQQTSHPEAVRMFLQERLQQQDSVIFLAMDGQCGMGFTQLYPSFSSVSMGRIWILNDLFVASAFRQQGVARLLMNQAADYAKSTGAIRMALSTQDSNAIAQQLYESLGYKKDEQFFHYSLQLLPR
jgi:ribosomal protein S18 acetylase RimI-like enzyme